MLKSLLLDPVLCQCGAVFLAQWRGCTRTQKLGENGTIDTVILTLPKAKGMTRSESRRSRPMRSDRSMNTTEKEDVKKALTSQTLVRGLDVIEAVSDGPLSISDIAHKTGITYGTAHRIVSVLVQRSYLKHDKTKGYTLGRKVLELGFQAFHQTTLMHVAHPFLEKLALDTLDTVHLARIEGDSVVYLDKIFSRRSVEISSRIGGRKPLISTGVGKALILDWSESEWVALHNRYAHLLRKKMTQSEWLDLMRGYAQGDYSFDSGEDEQAIRCVAAPVRDGSRKIVAAISVSSTLEYMDPERMQMLIPVVKQVAAQISAELGMHA